MRLRILSGIFLLAQTSSAVQFTAPYKQDNFQLVGDAKISDNVVSLAQGKNQIGGVWYKTPVNDAAFTLEAVIKTAQDPNSDVGKSGYTIWYTDKPVSGENHGGSDTWDGLAIMIDSLANGKSGSVRGHLNAGDYKFSSLKDIDTESLSLCRIAYRQITNGITIRVGYSEEDGFVVDVNGQKCFMSTDIVLPRGYYFGVTANSDISGDTLSVEKLETTNVFKRDLQVHLPQLEDKVNAAPKVEAPTKELPADGDNERFATRDQTSSGASYDEISKLIEPALTRLELMDLKLNQVQSVVDQLVDTLTVSMSQITNPNVRNGDDQSSAKEAANVRKEIQNVRQQIVDWRQQSGSSSPSDSVNSTSLWKIIAVLVPVQMVLVLIYHNWLRKRQERHEKLL